MRHAVLRHVALRHVALCLGGGLTPAFHTVGFSWPGSEAQEAALIRAMGDQEAHQQAIAQLETALAAKAREAELAPRNRAERRAQARAKRSKSR